VLDKLEVHSRAAAISFVLEHDLVDRPPEVTKA
jgi:DNA-binding NarL/FixJ family response regulator